MTLPILNCAFTVSHWAWRCHTGAPATCVRWWDNCFFFTFYPFLLVLTTFLRWCQTFEDLPFKYNWDYLKGTNNSVPMGKAASAKDNAATSILTVSTQLMSWAAQMISSLTSANRSRSCIFRCASISKIHIVIDWLDISDYWDNLRIHQWKCDTIVPIS